MSDLARSESGTGAPSHGTGNGGLALEEQSFTEPLSEAESLAARSGIPAASRDATFTLVSLPTLALLAVQGLGTLNDNLFRWLSVAVAIELLGEAQRQMALGLGLVCFTVPFLLCATHAGYLADRFSKNRVLVILKFVEIPLVLLGVWAISLGSVWGMLAIVAVLGGHAALQGPCKYAALPEIVRPELLSLANGLMGLVTVVAAAAGTILGFALYDATRPAGVGQLPLTLAVLAGIAGLGAVASLLLPKLQPADPRAKFPWIPAVETLRVVTALPANMPIFRCVLGIAFFWGIASLAQLNVMVYGTELQLSTETEKGLLLAILVIGVATGNVFAGWCSNGRVELGLVPPGIFGVVFASFGLAIAGWNLMPASSGPEAIGIGGFGYARIAFWLLLLGVSAGVYTVPLDSFLQERSPRETRGSILAASNFLNIMGMLITDAMFYTLQKGLGASASYTFLSVGLLSIPVAVYVVMLLPQAMFRFLMWLITRFIYRIRIAGLENIPATGGALLVSNHVTWADGVLLTVTSPRPVRFLAYADFVMHPALAWISRIFSVIPIKASEGPKSILRALHAARDAVLNGEVVCIFAEGTLTRSGQLQPFQRGLLKIVDGTNAPIVPVYLDGLWGSIFSYRGGKFFWKIPKQIPYPVTITFGKPLYNVQDAFTVRQAVLDVGGEAVNLRKQEMMVLPRQFLREMRRSLFRKKLADANTPDLTGAEVLIRAFIFRRLLRRDVLTPDEKMVGVLLPPSVGGALANVALILAGRIPVNLNYTTSSEVMNACAAQCGMKHVLTSRKFVETMGIRLNVPFVYLEDFKDKVTLFDKICSAVAAYAVPSFILDRWFGLNRLSPDDLLTVVFTSGSTGTPKGVMLSFQNVGSNIESIDQLFQLSQEDTLIGVLPFFHSFGFTGTLWTVLTMAPKGVYHFNPLDAKVIGRLCEKHKGTILMATPTFLRTYVKRCDAQQLKTLDTVVVGAEKMPIELAQAFQDKFGARPIEGYGTTEMSPLASVNVPDHRSSLVVQKGTKEGTVGRPIPNVAAKVVDPDTGADLVADQPGLLMFKGPNIMQGYLNQPELTAQVLKEGWYITGDIAKIDNDGFITITDRLSRFSKIGGEMVPHLKIEEVLAKILSTGDPDDQELRAAVTALPDEKRGERLVVIHKPLAKPVEQVIAELEQSGLPNLWLPSRDSFVEVPNLPVLGSGKLDLKGLKAVALERLGG